MSQSRIATMTPEEFLAWESKQEGLWEFDGFRPVSMNGGTFAHCTIQANLQIALRSRLRVGPCKPAGPTMRVATGAGRYRYPDAVVTCSAVTSKTLELAEPVVIFEVSSEGTSRIDRGEKLLEYRAVPSLRRYVMIEQDEVLVTVVAREGELWTINVLRADGVVVMPEIGIEIPVGEIYSDVELLSAEG